jgi:hypothetical protein
VAATSGPRRDFESPVLGFEEVPAAQLVAVP